MGRHVMSTEENTVTSTDLIAAEGPDIEVSDSIAPPPGAPDTPPSAPEGPPPFTDPEPAPYAPDERSADNG